MEKNRAIYIFKHLWDSTDEEHPATIQSIIEHLKTLGIETTRKTVMADLDELSGSGFDIVCNKGRPNQYFVGNRYLELPELKLLTDAVQAAKFISEKKTYELIEKLSSVASPHQGNILKRRLYVDGKTKTDNEKVYYIVDLLHNAIIENTAVCFKYYEYNADKQKVHKHNGQVYEFSPYDLVWSNDSYYVFGYSESHGKAVKFRVDRMDALKQSEKEYHAPPVGYSITDYCNQVFMMYDGKPVTVRLRCENSLMKAVVDRAGIEVKTEKLDDTHFSAEFTVSVSPTFFSWVFTYAGKMQITAPREIVRQYRSMLENALNTD
ncbi:MAG: WYL domain-containing protein [Clostridiales bacterium]|nr:MAG: WYL domain-containing protein [Clostridiales bacterium]